MTYDHDRNDDTEKKCELAEPFLENPTHNAFAKLVAHDGFWAIEPRRSIDYCADDIVFDDQTPEEVATPVEQALEDTDLLEDVLELDGFGWATATEHLYVLAPDNYAIPNKRAVARMKPLGYDAPNRQTVSVEEYWDSFDDVREAYEKYNLRAVVNQSVAPDVSQACGRS